MISCREICKLYFWCNDITLFSPYDFYNASKSTFATDVVGCLCQLGASNFGFSPGPKNHRAGPDFFSLGSRPISWCSKRQPTVALSSTEAEYRLAAMAAQESTWLKQLMEDLHQPTDYQVRIFCDNYPLYV